MAPQKPPFPQDVPQTPIAPGDLAALAAMLIGYSAFVRLAYRASPLRDAYLSYFEDLRQRLAGKYAEQTAIMLTVQDLETIDAAIQTFEIVLKQMEATKKHDADLVACTYFRQQIAAMLSRSPGRRTLF